MQSSVNLGTPAGPINPAPAPAGNPKGASRNKKQRTQDQPANADEDSVMELDDPATANNNDRPKWNGATRKDYSYSHAYDALEEQEA